MPKQPLTKGNIETLSNFSKFTEKIQSEKEFLDKKLAEFSKVIGEKYTDELIKTFTIFLDILR